MKKLLTICLLSIIFLISGCDLDINVNQPKEYNITFDSFEGTKFEPIKMKSFNDLDLDETYKPLLEGYIFHGWFIDIEFKTSYKDANLEKDTILYAKYNKDTNYHLITFELNNDSNLEPVLLNKDEIVSKPSDPIKKGYIFLGWYLDNDFNQKYEFKEALNRDVTIYARFEKSNVNGVISYSIEEDILSWEKLNDSNKYLIYIGNEVNPITIVDNSINLKQYENLLLTETEVKVFSEFKNGLTELLFVVRVLYKSESVIYSTGFEQTDGFTTTTNYQTLKTQGPTNFTYSIKGSVSVGTQTNRPITGTQGAQLRYYTASPNDPGYLLSDFKIGNIDTIAFKAKSNHHDLELLVGTSKTNLEFQTRFTLSSTAKDFEYKINKTEEVYFMLRLVKKSETNSSEVFIDDLVLYSNASGTRLVEVKDVDIDLEAIRDRFASHRANLGQPQFSLPLSLNEYYASLNGLTGSKFKQELQNILVNTHRRLISYDEARFVLEQSDKVDGTKPYLNGLYTADKINIYWDGGATWAREHVWPNSRLGIQRVEGSDKSIGSDVHNLRAINPSTNSSRSNRFFNTGKSTLGSLVGSDGYYPGDEFKGDVARILFYMVVRYNNVLTLSETNLDDGAAYTKEGAVMGILSLLLKWHQEDPVDDFERNRNNVIYSYQGNRNPFIDNENYVNMYFS